MKFEWKDSHLTAWGTSEFGDFISDMGVGDVVGFSDRENGVQGI